MNARKYLASLALAFTVIGGWTATAAAPGDLDVAKTMARAAREAAAGRFERAASLLDVLADAYPEDYRIHLSRAYYRLHGGDPKGAEADYRKALEVSGGAAEALAGLADSLAAQGRRDEALEVERRLLNLRPGEPGALNRYAYALFRAGDYRSARVFYGKALALKPGDKDALLGLGWCALRLGLVSEARARFQAVLDADPENAGARDGLRWAGAGTVFTPRAFLFAQKFQGHPWRNYQVGVSAGVDGVVADHVLVGLSYRYLFLQGTGGSMGPAPRLQQHEAAASVGWVEKAWGLVVDGAYVHYAADALPTGGPGPDSGMVGLSARYTWWADMTIALMHSFYDDFGVSQADLGVVLPVIEWLDVVGGFEVQYGDGRLWPSGLAAVRFHEEAWYVSLGGTFGTRLRPVDLARRAIYNTPDRPSGTAWVQAGFPLGSNVTMHASYDFTRLLSPSTGGRWISAYGHGVGLGFSMTLH